MVDYSVTIYAPGYRIGHMKVPSLLMKLNVKDLTETLSQNMAPFIAYREIYIIISNNAGPADYMFGLMKFPKC